MGDENQVINCPFHELELKLEVYKQFSPIISSLSNYINKRNFPFPWLVRSTNVGNFG